MSFGELFEHLYFSFEFSSFRFWSWNVNKYLGPIKGGVDHGIVRDPRLLANFVGEWGIVEIYNKDSNGNGQLSRYFLNDLRKLKISNLPGIFPRGKKASLEIVAAVGEMHLHSDGNYFGIVNNDSAIVECSFVQDRAANFSDDSVCYFWYNDVLDNVPRMVDSIVL